MDQQLLGLLVSKHSSSSFGLFCYGYIDYTANNIKVFWKEKKEEEKNTKQYNFLLNISLNFKKQLKMYKLDGVDPVDNRPSTE